MDTTWTFSFRCFLSLFACLALSHEGHPLHLFPFQQFYAMLFFSSPSFWPATHSHLDVSSARVRSRSILASFISYSLSESWGFFWGTYSSSSSSSPLLSLVTSTSEISHQPVHTYTTYIWQRGRQNRKTGNVRKIQHLHEEREEKKKFNPQTMLHWGVQCENRKKTPQHKSTYTINTWLATGEHIQLWQAAVRSGAIYYGAGRRPARQVAVQSVRRQLIGGGE